jgi:hypothetical protein
VQLARLTASPVAGAILLRWTATAESDHLGYRIERATDDDATFRRVGPRLIPGAPPFAYAWRDTTVKPGRRYRYQLVALDVRGGEQRFGPVTVRSGPSSTAPVVQLHAVRPNPARDTARVTFTLGAATRVELRIYDVAGRHVRTLVDGALAAGPHHTVWGGLTDAGRPAAAGTYFIELRAAHATQRRKIVLMPR